MSTSRSSTVMPRVFVLTIAVAATSASLPGRAQPPAPAGARAGTASASLPTRTPGAGPVVVVETVRGTFEFETYPAEAPKTVEHVLNLVKRGFYNGQRFHRAVPGFVVQVGDPQSRDMTKRDWWGRGDFAGSGKPVGVAEFSKKRLHGKGAVAMAHSGNAAQADAQFYVTLAAVPRLNGKYTVFGQVIAGHDVPAKIRVEDMVKRMSLKPEPAR